MANNVIPDPLTVDQGAAGAEPWPVDIQGGTVSVSNLQQLSVLTVISDDNYDLAAAAYAEAYPFSVDALLADAELRFTTAESRTITFSLSNGTVLFTEVSTDLSVELKFEDYAIDAGTTLTLSITQTSGACVLDATVTAKVGTAALGGNPVLGASSAHIGNVGIDAVNSAAFDAFGRLRVSQPESQFEVHHQWDLAPLYVGETADSTGAVTHAPPAARLTVDAGEIVKHQSHLYIPYLPGKSRLVNITAVFPAHIDGLRCIVGYGDDDDGIFFLRDENGAGFALLRSSTIGDLLVAQEDWNVDVLDGTGQSGVDLFDGDVTQAANVHFCTDFQWLSLGQVRWGFEVNGVPVYFHEEDFSNRTTGTLGAYMRTGSLPVRWEIEHTGASGSAYMDAICASVMAEGGHDPSGLLWSVNNEAKVSVGASLTPLLSIRPRATFNSLTNRGNILPGDLSVLADNDDVMIEVYIAGTVTPAGGAWTKVDTTTSPATDGNSHAEWTVPTDYTPGRKIASFPVAAGGGSAAGGFSGSIDKDLLLFVASDGYQLPLTICARRLGGAATAAASLQWVETR